MKIRRYEVEVFRFSCVVFPSAYKCPEKKKATVWDCLFSNMDGRIKLVFLPYSSEWLVMNSYISYLSYPFITRELRWGFFFFFLSEIGEIEAPIFFVTGRFGISRPLTVSELAFVLLPHGKSSFIECFLRCVGGG